MKVSLIHKDTVKVKDGLLMLERTVTVKGTVSWKNSDYYTHTHTHTYALMHVC